MPLVNRICRLACWGLLLSPLVPLGQTRPAKQYITVAGKKMSYTAFGSSNRRPGEPLILLEAGFGASGSLNFAGLLPDLSKFAMGIGYDRNGEGMSEEDSTIHTDADIARRLHAFLKALGLPPPYILAGHSLGGAFIRMYTSLYPKEVAGLVFIDAPDFMLTKEQEEEIKRLTHDEKSVSERVLHSLEGIASDTLQGPLVRHRTERLVTLFENGAFDEYHSLAPFPDIPTAVLKAYNKQTDTSLYKPADQARFRLADRFRILNFSTLIAGNHHSEMILLPGYNHLIHSQDPGLVVSVIRRIYQFVLNRDAPSRK